jgi:hypothetical protein
VDVSQLKLKMIIGWVLSIPIALFWDVQMGYMFLLGWLFVDMIRKEPV